MARRDPYRLLGVTPGASVDEVRAAFRKMVRQSHPDTASHEGDDSEVRELIDAYRLLMRKAERGEEDQINPRTTWPEGSRRIHVRRGQSPTASSGRAAGRCGDCAGSGTRRFDLICPDCEGRAEITTLDGARARIVRCQRCHGRGRVGESRQCASCAGSGTISQ